MIILVTIYSKTMMIVVLLYLFVKFLDGLRLNNIFQKQLCRTFLFQPPEMVEYIYYYQNIEFHSN